MEPAGGGPERAKGLRQNLTLLVFSIGVMVVVGELIARFALWAPLPWLYPQIRYQTDPDLVFTLAPDQVAFTADKPVRINSRKLRGPLFEFAPRPGYLRILWLGDSIVFGFAVTDEEVVTQRVADRMERAGVRTESINTGVPAYDTEQEVSFLAHDGIRYHPDWVILGFCWNDINDQLGAWVCPNGWLVSKTAGAASCESSFMESSKGYAIRNVVKRSRLAYSVMESVRALHEEISPDDHTLFRMEVLQGQETKRVRAGWKRVEEAVHRLRILGEKAEFRTLIVAFPLPLALDRSYPKSEYPSRLRDIALSEGLPFLDLEPSFRRAYRGHASLFIPYDADHPNAAGHDLAARETVAFLLDHRQARAESPRETSSKPVVSETQ
jgi:lysophospholipase L1-like esterase